MLLWCFILYSQYLEPQSFLGSHLDKSAPSSHCEDSGKEGSSVLVSTNKWRKMRTVQYVFQPQQPKLLVSHRVNCYTAEVWATKLECMTDTHSFQKNPKSPHAEAVSVRKPVTLSNSRAGHRFLFALPTLLPVSVAPMLVLLWLALFSTSAVKRVLTPVGSVFQAVLTLPSRRGFKK